MAKVFAPFAAIAITMVLIILKGYMENKFNTTLDWEPAILAVILLAYFEIPSKK